MEEAAVSIGKMTRREFRERMQNGELQVCIIPVAATEQHLEHLAMEHDHRSCTLIAESIAKALSPHVAVAPFSPIGISEHHMRHPGTMSASPGAFFALLQDAIRCLVDGGFKQILVLNGHGGNIRPLEGVWSQFLQRFEINLQFRSYWEFLPQDVYAKHLVTGTMPGHAQEFETAMALAAFPENVRASAMADQPDQEPTHATAETGKVLIDEVVSRGAKFVRAMMDGQEVAEIPPFFE